MPSHPASRTRSLCGLSAVWLLILGSPVFVQSQAPAGPPVAIDFRAVTDAGQPVLDLKAADVTLKVNGKVRELREFKLVQFAGADQGSAPLPAAPPFGTNVVTEGRDIMILVDEESIAPGKEPPVKAAMNMLMAKLGPRDRIGVLSLRQGGVNVAPTTRRQAVTAAIASLEGHALTSETPSDFTCRSRQALMTLQGVFTPQDTPARTFVFYSASLSTPTGADRMVTMGASSGVCQLTMAQFDDFGAAVRASRASLYVVHTLEAAPRIDPQALGAGLENVAGVSNSTILRMGSNAGPMMDTLERQTSAYYVASFDPEPSERNGSTYRLELRVARDGVKTHTRGEMIIPKPGAKTAVKAADMIGVATTYNELPLRGVGFPSRNPGDDKIRVLALFEPAEPGTTLNAAVVGLFDDKGKLRGKWTAQAAELAKPTVTASLVVPPGAYRMRIAATDAEGRAGTVDYEVRAELTAAGPVKLSSLVMGLAQNGFTPKLLLTPAEEVLVGYFEAYGVPQGTALTATLELAQTEDAPAMATAEAKVTQASAEDMRIIYGGFGVAGLKPGEYVMRAIVNVDGKPVGRLTRTLRRVDR